MKTTVASLAAEVSTEVSWILWRAGLASWAKTEFAVKAPNNAAAETIERKDTPFFMGHTPFTSSLRQEGRTEERVALFSTLWEGCQMKIRSRESNSRELGSSDG